MSRTASGARTWRLPVQQVSTIILQRHSSSIRNEQQVLAQSRQT